MDSSLVLLPGASHPPPTPAWTLPRARTGRRTIPGLPCGTSGRRLDSSLVLVPGASPLPLPRPCPSQGSERGVGRFLACQVDPAGGGPECDDSAVLPWPPLTPLCPPFGGGMGQCWWRATPGVLSRRGFGRSTPPFPDLFAFLARKGRGSEVFLGAWGFATPPAPSPLRGSGRGVQRVVAGLVGAGVLRCSLGLDSPTSLPPPSGRGIESVVVASSGALSFMALLLNSSIPCPLCFPFQGEVEGPW
ncbi:hypothetical protein GWK47_007807 [Chionoecetes opilio]|uniref:Uncharacterized protein n=1 Tax=Chionoecetes opilio TaxID=41210 RepID=A0A8J4Y6P9_CHIOP|nr:hypothetical protein GWK47_007807 [Chionoecetes opilio]